MAAKVYTATGKEFDSNWCGVAFTGDLFVAIANSDFSTLLNVFSDPEETKTITFRDGNYEDVHEGFTKFMGFQYDQRTDLITVNLAPERGEFK